ncbi:hypothetical protein V500_10785 [Pseudogymnoascus sp. VKM F-4518 (FW-2643)]|nr:hypothetical protein V500_10785 [Pseudogymnoascus sp. VKM F-4518 (FW-2643)]
MSPADKAALRKRLQEIKESIELCATAPFSRVLQMPQEELKKLMLNLGEQRPTREPGNTMRREVMKLQGLKFRAFCRYAQIWDTVGKQYEAMDAAEARLHNHKGATVVELLAAIDVLKKYLATSDKILEHGFDLIKMLHDDEALTLRQLVSAQGEATVHRQDRVFYLIEASHVTISIFKFCEAVSKPFKLCTAGAKKICRKIRKAKKKKGKKGKKGKKTSGCLTS